MELFFLGLLFFFMIWALTSGFPVAFALPGSAILSIGLAALSGYLVEGNASAYFAQDGPSQWLSAGVTNFRSLYWIVERDTLIAIPRLPCSPSSLISGPNLAEAFENRIKASNVCPGELNNPTCKD